NVFVVGALDLARRGGRLAAGAAEGEGLPVLALADVQMQAGRRAHHPKSAVDALTHYLVQVARRLPPPGRGGDALTPGLAGAYAARLSDRPEVTELVRYEIGPSVGAHTGAGTFGACFFPVSP